MKNEDMELSCKRKHFLDEQIEKLKKKIMSDLFHALYSEIESTADILNNRQVTDIIASCFVMFARDLLADMFMNSTLSAGIDEIMDSMFSQIRSEVNRRMAEEKDKAH